MGLGVVTSRPEGGKINNDLITFSFTLPNAVIFSIWGLNLGFCCLLVYFYKYSHRYFIDTVYCIFR